MIKRAIYRGKAIVNQKHHGIKAGDWVIGSFIQSNVDAPCIIFGDGEQIEIDCDSLGQFITINEFKQTLFDGDFLALEVNENNENNVGLIYFCEETLSYGVQDTFGSKHLLSQVIGKVIGNKFDNAAMLKQLNNLNK
jgi:hypothetical protein